tara:strand:- start:892 stop:1017 length:126 start_codon:yes stop_codon:yes gene_type:complete
MNIKEQKINEIQNMDDGPTIIFMIICFIIIAFSIINDNISK